MEDQPQANAARELRHHAGQTPLSEWLYAVGLLDDSSDDFSLLLHEDWTRLGAETYTMNFSVVSEDTSSRVVAKACIKIPPTEVMDDWIGRRELISDHGVKTPILFSRERATILEEYIPFTLHEAYLAADSDTKEKMRLELGTTYKTLLCLGFIPQLGRSDFRSRGDDVVMIDFGEDLGGVSSAVTMSEVDIDARSLSFVDYILGRVTNE